MTRIKCVIFDFDQTLVDLANFVNWKRGRNEVKKTYLENGVPSSIVTKHDAGSFVLLRNVYKELLKCLPRDRVEEIQLKANRALEDYETEGAKRAKSLPGTIDILEWLREEGIMVAIASINSRRSIDLVLQRLEIDKYIDFVAPRGLPDDMKPNPSHVLYCLKRLGCKPSEAVMVGDTLEDMLSAKRAGLFSIGLRPNLTVNNADIVIDSLLELKEILQRFRSR